MQDTPNMDGAIARPSWDKPKMRRCLCCKEELHSEWSGERICSRCKNKSIWRSGGGFSEPQSAGRRR